MASEQKKAVQQFSPEAKAYRAYLKQLRIEQHSGDAASHGMAAAQTGRVRVFLEQMRNERAGRGGSSEQVFWEQQIRELKKRGILTDAILLRTRAFTSQHKPWECLRDITGKLDKTQDGVPDPLYQALNENAHARGLLERSIQEEKLNEAQARAARRILDVMLDQNMAERLAEKELTILHSEMLRSQAYDKAGGVAERWNIAEEPTMLVKSILHVFHNGLPKKLTDEGYGRMFPRAYFRRDFLTMLRALATDAEVRTIFEKPFTADDIDTFAARIHKAVLAKDPIVPIRGVYHAPTLGPLQLVAARIPQECIQKIVPELRQKLQLMEEEKDKLRRQKEIERQAVEELRQRTREADRAEKERNAQESLRALQESLKQKKEEDRLEAERRRAELTEQLPSILYSLYETNLQIRGIESALQKKWWFNVLGVKTRRVIKLEKEMALLEQRRKNTLDVIFNEAKRFGLIDNIGRHDPVGIADIEQRIEESVIYGNLKPRATFLLPDPTPNTASTGLGVFLKAAQLQKEKEEK